MGSVQQQGREQAIAIFFYRFPACNMFFYLKSDNFHSSTLLMDKGQMSLVALPMSLLQLVNSPSIRKVSNNE